MQSIEALLVRISPRYAVVNAVAARAEQLIRGDIPAIETSTRNPVLVAMEELALGKLPLDSKRASGNAPIKVAPVHAGHDVLDLTSCPAREEK